MSNRKQTKAAAKRNMLCQPVEWCRTVCSMGPCCLALLGSPEQSPTLLEMTVDGSLHSRNLLPVASWHDYVAADDLCNRSLRSC